MELFEIWTDYENLKYFREPHKLNRQQAIWYLKLQDYDLSGMVHTRIEVYKMDLKLCELVEQPWLQLIYCAVCLPHGCNFRW